MKWDIRRANQDDLAAILTIRSRAFGVHRPPEYVEQHRPLFEPERYLLAHDPADGAMVGMAGSYTFDVTMPGVGVDPAVPPTVLPTQGVTLVAVLATHRRQGILRALMAEQLRGFADEGLVLSVLLSSESGIYRRFGYGSVGRIRTVRIDRPLVRFRAGAPDPGGVRFVDVEQARVLAPDVHRRWAARTPGAVSRNDRWWADLLRDPEYRHQGATSLIHLAHQDGYAAYRIKDGSICQVEDFFAATEQAHAALWRVLLGMDLIETVTTELCPLDDPLPRLLEQPRQVRTTALEDGLWARILDVPAALSARRYRVEIDLVLEADDGFLGRGGRFRLRGGLEGACCEPSSAPAELRCDVATLAMLLFGSHRASELARAGLLAAAPAVVTRCDLAFGAEREVLHGSDF